VSQTSRSAATGASHTVALQKFEIRTLSNIALAFAGMRGLRPRRLEPFEENS
jgi:hypothetical protein